MLVDTEPLYFRANREVLEFLGISFDETQYAEYFLKSSLGLSNFLGKEGMDSREIKELLKKRDAVYARLLTTEEIFNPQLTPVIRTCSQKYFQGIVTSSLRSHFDAIHARTDLLSLFRFVLAREDYRQSKPHPEPYLLALEKTGFSQEEVLVIEDTPRGVQAAQAAGLRCLVLPSPYLQREDYPGNPSFMTSLMKLPEAIGEFNSP